jgi:DNA-binding NarL/FixJ family response regulator
VEILHANANTLVQVGLRAVIEKGGGMDSLELVSNSNELFSYLTQKQPDILIADYDQPGHFDATDIYEVRKLYPNIKLLVISSDLNQNRIMSILEKGIEGYLTKECDEGELINAIFALQKGDKFYCNKVINILLNKTLHNGEEDCTPASLSDREAEIISLISNGLTNKEVASNLNISVHTVNTHRRNIMKKLGVNSTSGLVLYAVKAGLIQENLN